jgi:hypothetical protein
VLPPMMFSVPWWNGFNFNHPSSNLRTVRCGGFVYARMCIHVPTEACLRPRIRMLSAAQPEVGRSGTRAFARVLLTIKTEIDFYSNKFIMICTYIHVCSQY